MKKEDKPVKKENNLVVELIANRLIRAIEEETRKITEEMRRK